MYWILAAIFLIALTIPRLRPAGVAGCIVLAVLLGWGMVQRLRGNDPVETRSTQERGRPVSPAVRLKAIPLASVAARNLQLSGGGAPFELSGRIVNDSPDTLLRSVTIRITRRDCYEGALDPSGCATAWQDRHWLPISVPPGQARDFEVSVWMRGAAPRTRGTARDEFELVAATGEIVPGDLEQTGD